MSKLKRKSRAAKYAKPKKKYL
uniref:Uncharacterized protein n=1 Tax=Rhizophora mucronata TaxID=61149 RepID=A0A2P2N3X4_RHIMU